MNSIMLFAVLVFSGISCAAIMLAAALIDPSFSVLVIPWLILVGVVSGTAKS